MTPAAPDTLVVTSCFGGKFWRVIPSWARHIGRISGLPIEIVSLDGGRYEDALTSTWLVEASDPNAVQAYGSGDLPRLCRIIDHLDAGVTCIQIDVDVQFRRDFRPLLAMPYDFIVSRAFKYPRLVADGFGFVCCTGFYIAKPSAKALCIEIANNLATKRFGLAFDQLALNMMLYEDHERSPWRQQDVVVDGVTFPVDVLSYRGCDICVLGPEVIGRNVALDTVLFGTHGKAVLHSFEPNALESMADESDR